MFLLARLLQAETLAALPLAKPYQLGEFWLRRFRAQAKPLCAAPAALMYEEQSCGPDYRHGQPHR